MSQIFRCASRSPLRPRLESRATRGTAGAPGFGALLFRFRADLLLQRSRPLCGAHDWFLRSSDHAAPDTSAPDRDELLQQARSEPRYRLRTVRPRYRASLALRDLSKVRSLYRSRLHWEVR